MTTSVKKKTMDSKRAMRKLKIGDMVEYNIGRGTFTGTVEFLHWDGYVQVRHNYEDIIRHYTKVKKV